MFVLFSQHEEQLTKLESEITTLADDSSSYLASEPPSVAGMDSLNDNSMDGFPDTSKEEDSLLGPDDSNDQQDSFSELRASMSRQKTGD